MNGPISSLKGEYFWMMFIRFVVMPNPSLSIQGYVKPTPTACVLPITMDSCFCDAPLNVQYHYFLHQMTTTKWILTGIPALQWATDVPHCAWRGCPGRLSGGEAKHCVIFWCQLPNQHLRLNPVWGWDPLGKQKMNFLWKAFFFFFLSFQKTLNVLI